jgi:hypothetical protein
MIDNTLVSKIYSYLVSRFNIGEVFLPKYSKQRPKHILWVHFIEKALDIKVGSMEQLATYCGYTCGVNLNRSIRSKYPDIVADKEGRMWFIYFLSLVGKKRCPCCNSILDLDRFSNYYARSSRQSKCKSCDREYRVTNRDEISRYLKEYNVLNASSLHKKKQVHYQNNKEDILEKQRIYRLHNKESIKLYYQNNKYLFAAKSAKRRAAKLQATPKWANLIAIKEIYQTCPEGYHVDHIVPLQSSLVCGLHCEFNLQHLPARENLSKSNKFEIM